MKNPGVLAIDDCGLIYYIEEDIEKGTCKFYRYNPDPEIQSLEYLPYIGGRGSDPGKFENPRKIIFDKSTMWILDAGNLRIQAFSRDNYQIKYLLPDKRKCKNVDISNVIKLEEPTDIGIDNKGYFYILDKKLLLILKCNINGTYAGSFGGDILNEPVGLAVSRDNDIYVIDKGYKGFIKFKDLEFSCYWDKIPGNDAVRLVEFLIKNFDVSWVKTAVIEKSDDDRTIKISDGKNFLSLSLNNEKTKMSLTINGHKTDEFVVTIKNDKLSMYEQGKCYGTIGDFNKISRYFEPFSIVIDRKENIFVLDEEGTIHQFDTDGGYQGKIDIPDFRDPIKGIAVDSKGNLYASGKKGIALLTTQQKYTKEQGVYYSKTLDSGIQGCQWHRLAFDAEIPQKSILEIYFYCSDEKNFKDETDALIRSDKNTTQQKVSILDGRFQWIGPERYFSSGDIILNDKKNQPDQKSKETKADLRDKKLTWVGSEKNPRNILFKGKGGRYLWLKIVLFTFDENVRPEVREMKVLYPRISYLRYLPAIYQEDPSSREFLERFLSIFETVFNDLEIEISEIFKYFDPDTTPENFLSWLASWVNIVLEEDWREEKKREFIRWASFLYKFKGTLSGIEKLIEIYTGKKPIILENRKTGRPLVLDRKSSFILGMNSLLIRTPIRGFRLGYDSILGKTALREVVQLPEDPFLPMAHSFTILLDLSNEEFASYGDGLKRILNDEKPAHTSFNLRSINEMGISGIYVGINTRVWEYKPIYLEREIRGKRDSIDNTIGYGVLAGGEGQGSRVERRSRLGYDVELI
ncbi:MAG TPA: phage tail protein I [Candidatus Methanoperedens sp.]